MKHPTFNPQPAYVYPDVTCECGTEARCPRHPCPGTFHFTRNEAFAGMVQRQVHSGRRYRAVACPYLAGAWHVEQE